MQETYSATSCLSWPPFLSATKTSPKDRREQILRYQESLYAMGRRVPTAETVDLLRANVMSLELIKLQSGYESACRMSAVESERTNFCNLAVC